MPMCTPSRRGAVVLTLFALALGGAAWFVTSTMPAIGAVSGVVIVLTGAAIGIGSPYSRP